MTELSSGVGLLPGSRLKSPVSSGQREEACSLVILLKGTNPIYEGLTLMISSNPNYLPKALPPNTITLRAVYQHVTSMGPLGISLAYGLLSG